MNTMNKWILALVCSGAASSLFAQLNESIQVENTLYRQLERSERLPETAQYKDTSVQAPKLNYSNVPSMAKTEVTPEPIQQANLRIKEKLDKLYKSYIKLGFGNYTNLLGEYYFNEERARDHDYGIHFKHLSTNGGIDDVGYNGTSTDRLSLYGKKYWNKVAGKLALEYERRGVYYYGFPADSFDLSKKDYQQVYNAPAIRMEMGSYKGDTNKLYHQESLFYRPFLDKLGTQEHFVSGTFSGGKFRNNEFYSLGAYFDVNAYSLNDSTGLYMFKSPQVYTYARQHVNGIFTLNPSVNTKWDQLQMRVGIKLALNGDNSVAKFYFFPDIDISYSLFNNIFIPYLKVGGDLIRNNYYGFSQVNPFVLNTSPLANTRNKLNIEGGFKGSLGNHTSFNISASYKANDDMPLFFNDTIFSFMNRFNVIYDRVSITRFGAQMLYRKGEKWHVLVSGNYYIYDTRDELRAWHLPNFDGNLMLIYDLGDKLIARLNTKVVGTREAWTTEVIDGQTPEFGKYIVKLDPYFDVDVQLEYRYTKRFSVFLNLNNVASQKYETYYKYRVQAFNLLGGLTYSF